MTIEFNEPLIAAMVSAGMGISFLLADPRTPTSRALSIGLLCAAASIVCNTTLIRGVPIEELPWYAGWLAVFEVGGFVAVYQWILYLRQTIPAENLQTRFGDNLLRFAQLLVIVYGVECVLWPELRALYFQNALVAGGGKPAAQFYLFALPLEVSMMLAAGAAGLLLRRKPDRAERRRLISVMLATPLIAAGLVLDANLAAPVTVFGMMVLLVGAIQYHVLQGQRSQFIGRFLSPQVEKLVRRQGLARAMQQDTRDISVICCDIRGFTAISALLPSDQILELLRAFYDAIGEVTTEFGATIKDYAGDGVLILLGAPIPCEDAREKAVRLAARLHVAVAPVLAHWSGHGVNLGFGVGVASGLVTVGVIGGARLEYVAVGPTVNLASRLCDHAGAGETLADASTVDAVGGLVQAEQGALLRFKGFPEPVRPYLVQPALAASAAVGAS